MRSAGTAGMLATGFEGHTSAYRNPESTFPTRSGNTRPASVTWFHGPGLYS